MIKSSRTPIRRSQISNRILKAAIMATPAVAAALLSNAPARAADFYWDINGSTPGGSDLTNATGTWNVANTFWNDAAGTGTPAAWVDDAASIAIFSAGTNVTAASTITVDGSFTLGGITAEDHSLTLAATTGTLNGTNAVLNFATGRSLTIGAGTNVLAGTWEKTGGGGFTLSNAQSALTALTMTDGELLIGGTGTAANMPNIVFNDTVTTAPQVRFGAAANGTVANTITGVGGTVVVRPNAANSVAAGAANFPLGNIYNFTGANNYSGNFIIQQGQVNLTGAAATLLGTSFDLNKARLHLDNTAANLDDRISGNVKLDGGELAVTGNAASATNEQAGAFLLHSAGANTITLAKGAGGTMTYTATDITYNGGTALVRGTAIGSATDAMLKFSAPTFATGGSGNTISVIPGIVAENTATANGLTATLTTHDAATGVRQLAPSEYSNAVAADVNLAPGAGATVDVTTSTSIHAIEFGGAGNVAATTGSTVAIAAGQTLTLSAQTIYGNATNASTISGGTLDFGSGYAKIINYQANTASVVSATSGALTISSNINSTGMTKSGSGLLALTGTVNLNGGNTYINQGALRVNAPAQLGSTVHVGHFWAGGAATFSTFNITSFGVNAGSLQLTGNNTYSGKTLIIDGGANGGGPVAGGHASFHNFSGNNTWAGGITLRGGLASEGDQLNNTIGGSAGTLTVSGVIGQDVPNGLGANLIKMGDASLVLTGTAANTFSGLFRVNRGTLIIEKNGALGTASTGNATGSTLVTGTGSATVAFRNRPSTAGFNYSTNEYLGLETAGFNGQAQLVNLGGTNTFSGIIAWGSTGSGGVTTVDVQAGSLTLNGPIHMGRSAAVRTVAKKGAFDLIISGDNVTALTGFGTALGAGSTFRVDQGNVILRSANAARGQLPAAFSIVNVAASSSLQLDNSLAVNTARVNPAGAINLTGLEAELKLIGNSAAPVVQPMTGGLNVASFSTITVQETGQNTELTLGTLSRTARGTALLRGMNTLGKIGMNETGEKGGGGGPGTNTISILPALVGDSSAGGPGTDFVTVEGGYARPLVGGVGGEYLALSSGNLGYNNTDVTAPTAINANTFVNSIKLTSGQSVTIAGGSTLTLNSGALLGVGAGSSTISGGTLRFAEGFDDGFGNFTFQDLEGIVTVPTGSSLAISSVVASDFGITKSGGGVLTLSGTNTYGGHATDGFTTINAGVLEFSVDANLGVAGKKIVLNGGTLRPLAVTTSTRPIELASLGVNTIETGSSADFTVTGVVSGNGLTKTGAGTLTLDATNTYTGGTDIRAGTLKITGTDRLGDPVPATNIVGLNGGMLQVSTTGTYAYRVNVGTSGSGFIIDPTVEASWSGNIGGTGQIRVDGGGILHALAPTPAFHTHSGTWLVTGGSTLKYSATNGLSTIASTTPGHFTLDNGRLHVLAGVSNAVGNAQRGITLGAGGGTIEATGGVEATPFVPTFSQAIAGTGNLTVTTDTFSTVVLAGTSTYVGDTIVTTGSNGRVTGKIGTGNQVNDGKLEIIGNGNTLGNVSGGGILFIGANATPITTTANHIRQASMIVGDGTTAQINQDSGANGVSVVNSVTLGTDSKLDLKDNKLITLNAPGTATEGTYNGVQGQVQAAYNFGSWNGPGITTSMQLALDGIATIGVATGEQIRGLGPTDTDLWAGQTISGASTLAMYTYAGDANLDGQVDAGDYGILDAFIQVEGATGYGNGDFNYDGFIDAADYGTIDNSIQFQGPPIFTSAGAGGAVAGLSGVTAVPEPASLTVVALGAMGLLGRRRRK